jgi:hypothetical protein
MPANTPRGYSYPLYTDPTNFPTQMQDLATDVDTDMQTLVNQIFAAKNRPSARATATAAQAIPINTDTVVTFAVEAYDNNAMIDLATNNTRIQLQQAGIYMLTTRISFAAAGPAGWVGMVRMDSSGGLIANPGFTSISGNANRTTEITVEQLHIVGVTVPDNITVTVRQNFTAPINITNRSICATKVSALLTGT